MATTFYLRANTTAPYFKSSTQYATASLTRGSAASSTTIPLNSGAVTAGGLGQTGILWRAFATRPLAAFTLSGSYTVNIRARETNAQANAAVGIELWLTDPVTNTESNLWNQSFPEMSATEAAYNITNTVPNYSIPYGSILVWKVYAVAVGSFGTSQSAVFFFDGPTANASGDSYITITPNVQLVDRLRNTS